VSGRQVFEGAAAAPVRIGFASAADGHSLAFRVDGHGEPILVYHGLLSSRQHWGPFVEHFGGRAGVVTWDYRGHGTTPAASGASVAPGVVGALTMEGFARDGHAVLSHTVGRPAALVGLSMGVQAVLEHYRAFPGDVRALVLLCGTFGHPLVSSARARAALVAIARTVGRGGRRTQAALRWMAGHRLSPELAYLSGGAHRSLTPPDFLPALFRHTAGIEPRVIGEVVASYLQHTAWDVLPTIRVPTLILAADQDQLTPPRLSIEMRDRIPGAELLVIPKSTHVAQIEYPERVNRLVERFLRKHSLL
jgi:pimeloyl-ACP methyl ester carboxylesterase